MSEPSEKDLRRRYQSMATYDLLRIVAEGPGDYTPLAVNTARKVIEERTDRVEPEILFRLAKDRLRESEGFWLRIRHNPGLSFGAGLAMTCIFAGCSLLGLGLYILFAARDGWTLVLNLILTGAILLFTGVAAIVWIKRRQAPI